LGGEDLLLGGGWLLANPFWKFEVGVSGLVCFEEVGGGWLQLEMHGNEVISRTHEFALIPEDMEVDKFCLVDQNVL
jgi:hypothetical protein